MARWITVLTPFDYRWPDRTAITAFTVTGEHMVKDEIADFAVAKGYAIDGKINFAVRSTKGRRRTTRAKEKPAAANARASAPVGHANAADADRPADRPSVADDVG